MVEDLYRPYRPKRRTRATIAKEKGLEPLAAVIILQKLKMPLLEEAEKYVSEEKGVVCAEDAIAEQKISLQNQFRMRQTTEAGFERSP